MPILRTGSWGLPEFGITEAVGSFLGRPRTVQGGSNIFGSQSAPSSSPTPTPTIDYSKNPAGYYPQNNPNPSPYQRPGLPTTPTGQSPTDILTNSVNQSVNTAGGNLDRDYEDAMAQANTAESGLRSQAGQATSELSTQGATTRAALESQRATSGAGITSQEQTAQKQSQSALQQARDLFRQTQQQNIAQLSGLGLSSSSVSEALAEKLGVETARRIAGVTGSRDEVLQNLTAERSRVNDFAKLKQTELEQNLQNQVASIQSQLLQGVQQINNARQMAATAKANARATLLSQAQQQIGQIQISAQQFAQQLQQWQMQKEATLADATKGFTVTPTDFTNLNNAQSQIQNITGVGGQLSGYQPTYQIGSGGKFTIGLNPKKDELANPFATQ